MEMVKRKDRAKTRKAPDEKKSSDGMHVTLVVNGIVCTRDHFMGKTESVTDVTLMITRGMYT